MIAGGRYSGMHGKLTWLMVVMVCHILLVLFIFYQSSRRQPRLVFVKVRVEVSWLSSSITST